jgi:hypothetical protein
MDAIEQFSCQQVAQSDAPSTPEHGKTQSVPSMNVSNYHATLCSIDHISQGLLSSADETDHSAVLRQDRDVLNF